ncbi:MAG: phosphatase PAP2 family protein [Candidatus Paracaedibacteraceae bacterium]|nr:phosphatase PAP2 family protein [Candidatus Paracaedibacteraceae bacterium]
MNSLSDIFLQAGQFHTIVIILLIGIYFVDRKVFLKVMAYMLGSTVINVILKNIFKVPLKSHIKKDWYAFPSGHAQSSATFYGTIMTKLRNPLITMCCCLVIAGICWALVAHNYHDWIDVIAAVGVSALVIILFNWVDRVILKDNFMLFVLILTIFSITISHAIPAVGSHTWLSQGALIGLTATAVLERFIGFKSINPLIDFLIALLGIIAIIGLFAKIGTVTYFMVVSKYALVAFWGTYSPSLFASLRR